MCIFLKCLGLSSSELIFRGVDGRRVGKIFWMFSTQQLCQIYLHFQTDHNTDVKVWIISHHIWSKYSSGLFPCCYEPITAFGCFGLYFLVTLWVSVDLSKIRRQKAFGFVPAQLNANWNPSLCESNWMTLPETQTYTQPHWWIIFLTTSPHYAKLPCLTVISPMLQLDAFMTVTWIQTKSKGLEVAEGKLFASAQ